MSTEWGSWRECEVEKTVEVQEDGNKIVKTTPCRIRFALPNHSQTGVNWTYVYERVRAHSCTASRHLSVAVAMDKTGSWHIHYVACGPQHWCAKQLCIPPEHAPTNYTGSWEDSYTSAPK